MVTGSAALVTSVECVDVNSVLLRTLVSPRLELQSAIYEEKGNKHRLDVDVIK